MTLPIDQREDEDLVRAALDAGVAGEPYIEELYRRHRGRVTAWCIRVCGNRDDAVDLVQEVFLRVQERLATFRFESRFTTWLYLVTRSVAINRGISERRRRGLSLDDESVAEPVAEEVPIDERLATAELGENLRRAIAEELDAIEAKVLYLHYVDGLTLPGIGELLGLTNKSGAKAFIVSAKRKLRRRYSGEGS
jgi:RNA polymerase sigma-70 factor (ECF subfamily)